MRTTPTSVLLTHLYVCLGLPSLWKSEKAQAVRGKDQPFIIVKHWFTILCYAKSEISALFCGAQIGCGRGSDIFKKNTRAWKKFFQRLKKFFQRLKKFFHALEKNFQALAIFLKIMACRWSAFQRHLAESGCKTKGEKGAERASFALLSLRRCLSVAIFHRMNGG